MLTSVNSEVIPSFQGEENEAGRGKSHQLVSSKLAFGPSIRPGLPPVLGNPELEDRCKRHVRKKSDELERAGGKT